MAGAEHRPSRFLCGIDAHAGIKPERWTASARSFAEARGRRQAKVARQGWCAGALRLTPKFAASLTRVAPIFRLHAVCRALPEVAITQSDHAAIHAGIDSTTRLRPPYQAVSKIGAATRHCITITAVSKDNRP